MIFHKKYYIRNENFLSQVSEVVDAAFIYKVRHICESSSERQIAISNTSSSVSRIRLAMTMTIVNLKSQTSNLKPF